MINISYIEQGIAWIAGRLGENFNSSEPYFVWLKLLVVILALFFLCLIAWWIARFVISRVIHYLVKTTTTEWDDALYKRKFFKSLAHIVPAVILNTTVPEVFADFSNWVPFLQKITQVYILVTVVIAINTLLNAIGDILQSFESLKDKPMKSYVQVGKIVIALMAFILLIAMLFGKSPLAVLGGFGAVTAVIILLFRDTILGFVASVQMSAIDMVKLGDWITMDKYGADGNVIEINLTSVKIQNFDKTITTIPSYALISDSFINWRGMENADGRRIKRHLKIKISSVKFIDQEAVEKYKKVEMVKEFIERRSTEIDAYNADLKVEKSDFINGRNLTNVGVFREYAQCYLRNHDAINQNMIVMVRHLQVMETGLPIEIYAFSQKKEWVEYEGVIADIFDHLVAAVKYFDLEIFESPSSSDFAQFIKSNS